MFMLWHDTSYKPFPLLTVAACLLLNMKNKKELWRKKENKGENKNKRGDCKGETQKS